MVTRRLEAELHAERGLSLADYDALVQLAIADDRRLRMSELADRVVLSRSGVSRLVDRLEADGLVARRACPTDARGSWAELTPAGLDRLRDAAPVHLRGVDAHFLSPIAEEDREGLVRALEAVVRGLQAPGEPVPPACAHDRRGARALTRVAGVLRTGTSGFAYPAWAPAFYPAGTRGDALLPRLRRAPRRGRAERHLLPPGHR